MDQSIYNLGVVLCDSTGATGLPRKSSCRRYGDLRWDDTYYIRRAWRSQPQYWGEARVWRTAKAFCQIHDIATGEVEGERERRCVFSCQGSQNSRELEPAIFRLWGKGVSITLARLDQFSHNLGVVSCDSTGATLLHITVTVYCMYTVQYYISKSSDIFHPQYLGEIICKY